MEVKKIMKEKELRYLKKKFLRFIGTVTCVTRPAVRSFCNSSTINFFIRALTSARLAITILRLLPF